MTETTAHTTGQPNLSEETMAEEAPNRAQRASDSMTPEGARVPRHEASALGKKKKPDLLKEGDKSIWLIACIIFAAASIIRILVALFTKSIDVMPDELRYLDIARSLFTDGTLVMNGNETDFQKILYPLFLLPAMFFHDTVQQIDTISVLNSLYVCSSVFPTLIIAKRIFKNYNVLIACMLSVMLLPDMMYNMTFMSESLYFPVALWTIALLWKTLYSTGMRAVALSVASGLLCYVAYLCKEMALGLVIAFVLYLLWRVIREKDQRIHSLVCLAAFLVGFLALFAVMKLTLFAGLQNSYSQTSPIILTSPYAVLFGVYATFTDLTYLIVGFAFFPLFIPLLFIKQMNRENRALAALIYLALAVSFLTIIYTISIREDVGHEALRQHIRYIAPLFVPLFFLCLERMRHGDFSAVKASVKHMCTVVGIVVASCVLVVTVFGSANLSQGFDAACFHIYRWFDTTVGTLDTVYATNSGELSPISKDDGDLVPVNPAVVIEQAVLVVFIVGGTIGLFSKRRREATYVIAGTIMLAACLNTAVLYQYNMKAYAIDPSEVDEISHINQVLDNSGDPNVLIIRDSGNTGKNNMVDTYVQDYNLDYRYTTSDSLSVYVNDDTHVLDQTSLLFSEVPGHTGLTEYDDTQQHFDYILVNTAQTMTFTSNNLELMNADESKNFKLFMVKNDEPVTVTFPN